MAIQNGPSEDVFPIKHEISIAVLVYQRVLFPFSLAKNFMSRLLLSMKPERFLSWSNRWAAGADVMRRDFFRETETCGNQKR